MIISLLDGTLVDSTDINLAPDNIHFNQISSGEDITFLMKVADKKSFPLFDLTKSNSQIYAKTPPAPTDGTFSIMADQLLTNPLGAPVEALNKGVSQIFDSSGVQKLILFAVVGAIAVLYFKREFEK